jgi:lactaldehyde dehydrogenase/glycolaldehyde dehydrogenase
LSVRAITASRVINSGQVCNCAERIYVQRSVADEFVSKLSAAMQATHYGDPLEDETVAYGPLINEAGSRKVERLVGSALQAGATLTTGGKRGAGDKGYFYEPTALTGCTQQMDIIQQEIFRPVIPVVVVDDLDEAIRLANDSEYGLTSSIYTRDLNVALRACQEIRFGETYINRENLKRCKVCMPAGERAGLAAQMASMAYMNSCRRTSSICSSTELRTDGSKA